MNAPHSATRVATRNPCHAPKRRCNALPRLAALAAVVALQWPLAAGATPAKDFASDITKVYFDAIRILYGGEPDHDIADHRRFPVDPKIRLVVADPSDIYIVTNTVAPGGYSGWHTHPGPSVVLVKTGTATTYDGDDPTCTPTVYPAGTGFIDPGDGHVHMVTNQGADTLVTQAFQIIPTGDSRRIDAPSPGYCPF